MAKPSTEQLKEQLKQLVEEYNKSIDTQQQCKQAIIATQAVIKDREDGDTDNSSSDYSED
tara:strand:+ start:894 stop:1073 length:180 start_codon:yes stop_codon:yes gene_type:complete